MKRKKKLLAAMLCAFSMTINSAAVVAQDKDKKQDPKSATDQAPTSAAIALPAPHNGLFIQNEFSFGGHLVKGAPYSAEAVTETIQTLADGNRIVQNSSAKIYRDSEGRTRREQSFKAIGPWAVSGEAPVMISINDPVSGVHYSLNSNTKTAHKLAAFMPLDKMALDAVRARKREKPTLNVANVDDTVVSNSSGAGFGTVTSVSSHTVVNGQPPAGASRVIVSGQSSSGPAVGAFSVARSANAVAGVAAGATGIAMPPLLPGAFSWYGEGEVNTESLGNQVIEGVLAEGQRVTVTIEAGKIGNERPIVTINERWYSPELQTIIFSKNVDPRMGETTYKLVNIDRSEPNSSLFQVPTDYTVEEGPEMRFRSIPPELPAIQKRRRPNEN